MSCRLCLLAACLVSLFVADRAAAEVPRITGFTRMETKIEEALDQPTQIEAIEMPLQDLFDYLEDFHKIPIQVDQAILDETGIGADLPITRIIQGTTLRSALRLVLRDIGLAYVIRDEVLLITTEDAAKAERNLRTVVYPVSELVGKEVELLVDAIRTTVFPSSWHEGGGPASLLVLQAHGEPVLVIAQTEEAHDRIVRLLEMLDGLGSCAGTTPVRADTKPAAPLRPSAAPARTPHAPAPAAADPFAAPAEDEAADPFAAPAKKRGARQADDARKSP